MAGFAAAIVALLAAAGLLAALYLAHKRNCSLPQAIALLKLRSLFRLQLPDRSAPAERPVIHVYARQSGLDVAVLWSFLDRRCLHLLHEKDQRSLFLFGLRLIGETAYAGDIAAIEAALAAGQSVSVPCPPEIEPQPQTLRGYGTLAALARKHGAGLRALHVRGSRFSQWSVHPRSKAPRHLLPRMRLGQSDLLGFDDTSPADNGATDPRDEDRVHDLMALARFRSNNLERGLFLAFRDACDIYGKAGPVLEDALGGKLTYKRTLIGARALGAKLEAMSQPGEALGILLPNANAVIVTFLALQSAGRVAAMLNYTAGPAALVSALSTARIRTVLSSRAFVDKAGLEAPVAAIENAGVKIVWLEELRESISVLEKANAFVNWRRPLRPVRASDPAVILFTSGSEGTPKGVVLSHTNIHANAAQAEARIDISVADRLFNVLPVFHCFGLTGGAILPLFYGVRLFLYPSPLHYRNLPAVAREVRPSIMFGTDTFLAGYARTAKDTDFESLRLIVAGAEAVRAETRRIYRERFNATVIEGFGMTETAPVAAVNSSSHNKDGTVGRLLPAMSLRLEPVEGINDAGRLYVSGPNIMLGYMLASEPGKLQPLSSGWHDSGDIVAVDEDGYIAIRGRAKRFAKIAGEMVSLGAIELMVQQLWPEDFHAAVAVKDRRKGERIVLVTTRMPALRDELREFSRRFGATELMVPGEIINVSEIPLLGSGKTDYVTAQKIADEWISSHRTDNSKA
ncbi:acyl-[acyl-carrier-protein]-phospholipid O-acyltransferase/long-chain-fatty-acid--[acyl-carrier-protein] ligase [Hoeflea halophila]|uniref:Acyl-[acyl-carrier-protein]-phospholipid O-acyltransferase/long-chain-fatty-acid--[acyl-carrier-protein] ligase n=1 Tax=Hoeflea halophila TaxID=714899 RepID=A0A286HM41_9HYPH|nr:AMP-binding protein [Hoeflea halophila]SOE08841.1 acyl-[acyl-carrier-protein]-phospholipid O-acyltransferase/long-chain-fatty-acid--[acyl-carrier-protein] ligase [Hoeflea halophila]